MKRGKTYSVPLWRVSVADFIGAIRRGTRLSVEQESLRRIRSGFDSVKSSLLENKIIYGVNTGIGDLCDKIIPPASLRELQKNIIVSHACGFEPFVDERVSRGVLFLKINSLAKGFSGVSPELVKKLISIFNNGISGLLPARGSLGASGDLIPLAHLGLLLLGKGRAYRGGSVQSSSALLKRAGISPYEFGPKEALALINGTEVLTSSAAHSVNRAENLFETSITATAALYEIFGASRASLDSKLHAQKPHPGQERVATMLRSLLRESVLCEQAQKKIQDALRKSTVRYGMKSRKRARQSKSNLIRLQITRFFLAPERCRAEIFTHSASHSRWTRSRYRLRLSEKFRSGELSGS